MMEQFAIAVHGGAGPDSEHIHKNKKGYEEGLKEAVESGYNILSKGGSAMDAVEAAVRSLEDNPLFNAGRGGAINDKGETQHCASIADGKKLASGAVAVVRNVRNPISLARKVMEKTKHRYLAAYGALDFARQIEEKIEPDSYFITEHQYDAYLEAEKSAHGKSSEQAAEEQVTSRSHGTVGAVALDANGNLAAATSTGGTEREKAGRVGDSSIFGVGSYADNNTCAVSTTGEGELLMKHVSAFHISAIMEYMGLSLEEACDYFMDVKCKGERQDMGFIAIDKEAHVVFKFNSERMHRGCKTSAGQFSVSIYPGK